MPPPGGKPTLTEGLIQVVHVLHYKAQNQFGIVKCVNHRKAKAEQREFISKGNFCCQPKKGDIFLVRGLMEIDQSRVTAEEDGSYYKVVHSEMQMEEQTTNGMVLYLQREGPGIGDIRARELVDHFGKNVITVLANTPNLIMEKIKEGKSFKGMDAARLLQLSNWAKDQLLIVSAKQKLYSLNIGPATVSRIMGFFGTKIVEVLRTDPFRLTKVDGIGFLTADKIAQANGCAMDDPGRIRSGILFCVEEHERDGHCCLSHDDLIEKAQKLLGIGQKGVTEQLNLLLESEELCSGATQPQKFSRMPHLFDIVK